MCERSDRTLPIIPGDRSSFVTQLQEAEPAMTKPMQRSYLLRLWRDHAGTPMRATLIAVECPDRPRHFINLDELFAFLTVQAYSVMPADDRPEWDGDHCTPDGPS
jgi:hypothetical protein